MPKELTEEQIQAIQNYGDELITIENFVKVVQKRPGMYLGSIGNSGFMDMVREVFDNGYDELNRIKSPCDCVIVSIDERNYTIIVEDNGRGIPFGEMIRVFTEQHTSSNFEKERNSGDYSSGLHGVGAKVTNAMSTKFIVESYNVILGEGRLVEFNNGIPWDKGEVKISNKEGKQGTKVTFTPNIDLLGEITVSWMDILNMIRDHMPLSKIGSKAIVNAIDINGKSHREVIVNEDGILELLINMTSTPLVYPVKLFKDTGEMKMDIVFTYSIEEESDANVVSFANMCPTISGYHIDGFLDGISKFFCDYMNKIYLSNGPDKKKKKKKEIRVTPTDAKVGLKAVVNVAHIEPIFNGQAKKIFASEDMYPFMKTEIQVQLEKWAKSNPKDFSKICKYLKDIAELRMKQDKEKVNLNKKYNSNALTGLPSKYVAPLDKKGDLELWITEGDSAGGTLENNRDNHTQGYFPIRGKLPNAFFTQKDKFLSNAEVAGIINIIGGGYGRSFDITKVKFLKIVINSDADADGDHICCLLLSFFILYMPGLVESGRVYRAVPPLYGITIKSKNIYFTRKIDYIKYVQKLFIKDNDIKYGDGKTISQTDLTKLLYSNIDYVYEIERISNRYAVSPELLETVLMLHLAKADYNKMKRDIEKKYRFLKITNQNGVPMITGSLDLSIQTLFVTDVLIKDCSRIINILVSNANVSFMVNNNKVLLYGLMKGFDESSPKNLRRFKGLGEMDGPSLYESTVNKDTRTLIQFTTENVKDTIESIRYYENNKDKLLEGITVSRFDVIG